MPKLNFQAGFTLVELLVVVALIGTIAAIGLPALNSISTQGRDTQRLSDLKKIQSSLEQYYTDQQFYPQSIDPDSPISSPQGTKTYLSQLPKDPKTRANYLYSAVPEACNNGNGAPATYCSSYCLYASVEDPKSAAATEGCNNSSYNLALGPTLGGTTSGSDPFTRLPTPTPGPTFTPTPTPRPTATPTPTPIPYSSPYTTPEAPPCSCGVTYDCSVIIQGSCRYVGPGACYDGFCNPGHTCPASQC